ncbi:MAG: hypothetical protein Q9179_003315 [Wetmoreana sp. 5 TL-2023]
MVTGDSSTMESKTLLNDDPFHSTHTQRLFEAIDELRSCGANHDIPLPELVIVGDQSAGKSSLLQSLTEIPFPVADRLCTRFPTRIVSRRTPDEGEVTKISIEPGLHDQAGVLVLDETVEEKNSRLDAYREFAYSTSKLTLTEFRDAIDRAKEVMGVTRTVGQKTIAGRNFARDVLKVEISGPDRSYFSILDVPGVFQSLTKGLTKQEKVGVREMVASYMVPSQSVIICVASGTNDLANQAAFDMASKHDPHLERTIGVITKCDVTQHKDQILSLAQNEEKHLNHGWFVVRNRTPEEVESGITSLERHDREKSFFNSGPWTRLPEARRGTQALKRYLADLLCERIQETFPTILAMVQTRLALTQNELYALGPSRNTLEEKRAYLTDIAQQYHSLFTQALSGRYHGLSDDSLKVRRYIREANDTFASDMIHYGHSVPFESTSDSLDSDQPKVTGRATPEPPLAFTANNNTSSAFGSQAANTYEAPKPVSGSASLFGKGTLSTPSVGSTQDAPAWAQSASKLPPTPPTSRLSTSTNEANTSKSSMPSKRSSPIYTLIREEIQNCRGTELQGTLNPDVLPALFHRQIAPWKGIATKHFQTVSNNTLEMLQQAANTICRDTITAKKVKGRVRQINRMSEEFGLSQLYQRADQIASHHLQTQNPTFEKNIREARLARFQSALEHYQATHSDAMSQNGRAVVIQLRDVTSLFDALHMSNTHNLEDEIHDILRSYYQLALHDFIEYVTQQVVESYLNHPQGPVLFFNPMYIGSLTQEGIEELAAEDSHVVRERAMKQETLARLTHAERIALKYA